MKNFIINNNTCGIHPDRRNHIIFRIYIRRRKTQSLSSPVAFHNLQTIYVVWYHEDATSMNDAGGDDEVMVMKFWYRRDT